MTRACLSTLSLSLLLYLGATLLLQGGFLLRRNRWTHWGRRLLVAGLAIHVPGMALHFYFSGRPLFSSMLILVSLLTIGVLVSSFLVERYTSVHHLGAFTAPFAFLALLYALLMPVRFDEAESLLLRYPWLGIHVFFSFLGYLGFALAFGAAVVYLMQNRYLKKGRLNRFLPPLDAAASAAYHFAAAGFSLFTLGLGMGIIWLFGAPGEYLQPRDAKIWMTVPTWLVFAVYLYLRAVAGWRGSRLKWLIVAGFLLALVNLLGVRHHFETPLQSSIGSTGKMVESPPLYPLESPLSFSGEIRMSGA